MFLKGVRPNYGYLMRLESHVVLQEAEESFLHGSDVATVMLAQSFMEYILRGHVLGMDRPDIARRGLRAMIAYVKTKEPRHRYLLDLVDEVRRFRNPFMHLRPMFDESGGLSRRLLEEGRLPEEILEEEAKQALRVMYQLVRYRW